MSRSVTKGNDHRHTIVRNCSGCVPCRFGCKRKSISDLRARINCVSKAFSESSPTDLISMNETEPNDMRPNAPLGVKDSCKTSSRIRPKHAIQ